MIARSRRQQSLTSGSRSCAPAGSARVSLSRPVLVWLSDHKAGRHRVGDSHSHKKSCAVSIVAVAGWHRPALRLPAAPSDRERRREPIGRASAGTVADDSLYESCSLRRQSRHAGTDSISVVVAFRHWGGPNGGSWYGCGQSARCRRCGSFPGRPSPRNREPASASSPSLSFPRAARDTSSHRTPSDQRRCRAERAAAFARVAAFKAASIARSAFDPRGGSIPSWRANSAPS
jgi:hypothetical protein